MSLDGLGTKYRAGNILLGGSLVAVTQMATVRKVKTHQTVVRAHESLVDLQVGRATTQALNVNTPLLRIEAESLESTSLAGKLNGINVLITTIVTSSRITLRVLVGHGRAKCIENSTRGEVLGGNQDNGYTLALDFFFLERLSEIETQG